MSFTVVRPEANGNRSILRPRANKHFIDGVEVKQARGAGPMWWSLVASYNTDNPLPEIYKTLVDIEQHNHDYVILAEPLKENRVEHPNDWFRLKAGDYFVKDYPRNWIQLDFDHGPSGCNSLPISQRLNMALAGLPQAFSSCECVAQLSSKAFHPDYPDYFGLRVYFALKTPYTNAQLRQLLSGLPHVDASVFSNVRRHYTSVLYEGTKQPQIEGSRVAHKLGRKLDLQLLEADEDYIRNRRDNKDFQIATRNFQTFTPQGEQMEELVRLAQDGYFERVERHVAHWKILKKAEWTNQNGADVLEAILDAGSGDGTILGNRADRESLEHSLEMVREELAEHFHYDLKEQSFDHIISDPQREDLKGADLSELENTIRDTLDDGRKAHVVIRSPHGSAKTTEIIPILTKLAEEKLGRPARVLYICTLRSIIRGTAKQLCFECYINENGEVQKHVITTADKLGICIKSLIHTERPFDVVIRDEAEQIGLWASWDTSNDTLRDYSYLNSIATHPQCIINCLMDADAADLTYEQLYRNLQSEQDVSILMENTGSWIKALDQTLHWWRKPRLVLNKIYDDAITENKMCFVHVDFGDRDTNPKLTAVVNAFNDLAGYEIAKGYWSDTPSEILNRLTDTPNEYIQELHSQGVRIVIVSPVIVSGWRYKVEPHFDATYGIYENNTQTALAIIQRTQRVTHVRDHHLYVSPVSSYTQYENLMRDVQEELEYFEFDHSLVIRRDEAFAKELVSKAKAKSKKLLDNVKLHTILYWDSFGGHQKFCEFDDDRLPELDVLGDAVKEQKQRQLEKTASAILNDAEHLEHFTTYFKEYDVATAQWIEMYPPKTTEQILKLLRIAENSEATHETARTVCELLRSTETDWMRWDLFGADWQKPDVTQIAELPDFTNKTTFRVLGKILQELQVQLAPGLSETLTKWLSGAIDTPIVIETRQLKPEQFPKILNRYYDLLKTNVPDLFSKGITNYEKFIVSLFRKILICDVTVKTPNRGKVTALKQTLVAHYQEQGLLPKGDVKNRKLQDRANTELANRIQLGFELSETEQDYFDNTGKIIVIKLPKYRTVQRELFHKVHQVKTVLGTEQHNLSEAVYEAI